MNFEDIARVVSIALGIMTIGAAILGLLVFALLRRLDERRDAIHTNVLMLTEKERDAYKAIADHVPALETAMHVLQEQVSGAKAIAEHDAKTDAANAALLASLRAMEERAQHADAWQAAYNRATVEACNQILAVHHKPSVHINLPLEAS